MKPGRFIKFWNLICNRAITFYLLAMVVSAGFVDYDLVLSHARGAALSRLIPPFNYLYSFANGLQPVDREKLKEYAYYFEKVNAYVPRADAYGVLGYLYFHLGKDRKAVACFKKASRMDPQAFNFHYNLGVIYFNRQFYEDAIPPLEKALETSVAVNLNYITSSKVYFRFLGPQEDIGSRLNQYLREGFQNTYRLLVSSSLYLKDYRRMLHYATAAITAALDEDKEFHYYAGLAAFHLGKFVQAGAFLKEYVQVHPNDSSALYYLGMTLKALGDEKAAEVVMGLAKAASTSGVSIESIHSDTISLHIF